MNFEKRPEPLRAGGLEVSGDGYAITNKYQKIATAVALVALISGSYFLHNSYIKNYNKIIKQPPYSRNYDP